MSQTVSSESATKVDSLVQLMGLVQQQATLKHKELSLTHSKGVEKLQMIEEAIKHQDGEECDDVRAQVVLAKGKVQATAVALKTCLETKKVISVKIAAIEKARASAQAKLDACISTKAKLKAALHECHTRRDSAKEKLEECLTRKKELKIKIDACHVKRDEARTKLAQCLAAKKSLSAKIEAAKKKVGSLSSASLLEIMNEQKKVARDLEPLLEEVEGLNDESDEATEALVTAGEEENAAIGQYQAELATESEIVDEIQKTEGEEAEAEVESANLDTELEGATQDMQQMDADSTVAASACATAEGAVNSAGAALLAYQAKISKQ
jgi:chromosome segregation ATPase